MIATRTLVRRASALLAVAALFAAKAHGQNVTLTGDAVAELPRVLINTDAPAAPAPGGTIIKVAAGGNLQAALDRAEPGDVIELAPGAVFVGNFVLPLKRAGEKWIVIRPGNYDKLPRAGTRLRPRDAEALQLPRILTPNSDQALRTAAGAHHYRLVGLEVSATPTNPRVFALVGLDAGDAQRTMAQVPHHFVLDRMFVHGTTTMNLRRCVALNSGWSAVIDSWLSDCHDSGADSQAIAGWNGPGPFKIVNNYLEGAAENVMFGGGDPSVPGLTPSDIEIRRNHFFKPLAWKNRWLVKNLLEFKHAQRVLVEGNVLENSWKHGQNGVAIAIKSVNQDGRCTWCVTQDVTVRLNLIRNAGAGINIAGAPEANPVDVPARRILVIDNAFVNLNVGPFDGGGRGFAIYGTASDVTLAHNIMLSPTHSAFEFGPERTAIRGFSAHDNIVGTGEWGIVGQGIIGGGTLPIYAPYSRFTANALVGSAKIANIPQNNFQFPGVDAVEFVDANGGDYRLGAKSWLRGRGTGGTDVGPDMKALLAATVGVIMP